MTASGLSRRHPCERPDKRKNCSTEDQSQSPEAGSDRNRPHEYGERRRANCEGRGCNPKHAHAGKREYRSCDRNASSLASRPCLSEGRKSDETACNSVKRAGQAVEQFAANVAKKGWIRLILGVWSHQLRCRALTRSFDCADLVHELRQIDGVVVKCHHRRVTG